MSDKTLKRPFDLTKPHHLLALGFGAGLIRFAPGTWGTLAAVPFFLLMSQFSLSTYLIITLVVCVLGFWICGQCAKDVGVHDHPGIVWDEFGGFFITMIAIEPTMITVTMGFILFRFFDIVKPWPISWLDQKVAGGFGIMIDDIIAGLFAAIVMHLILPYMPIAF